MKQAYNLLLLLCSIFFMASCQEDLNLQGSDGTGYLLLTVSGSNETTTRSANLLPGYTGRQIAVEVINDKDSIVKETDDWENWKDMSIKLPVGKYTIKAYSYGFDGKQSAMAAPYYYGTKTVNIEKDKELQETVTCRLANVKMSVKIANELKEAFKSFTIYVTSKEAGKCDPIYFNIDLSATAIKDTAYFPITDLVVKYAATNQDDKKNEATRELTGVKGNDHYILNFTLGKAENGNSDVTVEVDETLHIYEYTFTVSQTPTNGAQLSANAWAKFAYLTAENVTATSDVDLSKLKLQYRQKDAKIWNDLETSLNERIYTATASNLTPNTTYLYRLVNDSDFKSDSLEFTTEIAKELPNGDFEEWCDRDAATALLDHSTAFPCSGTDYDKGNRFWDTSNRGANSMGTENPTNKTKEFVQSGTYAAKLSTISVFGKLAAASLYVGDFGDANISGSATINFGKTFTSRPIALEGYYKYTPKVMNKVDRAPENVSLIENKTIDKCAIYIALTKGPIHVNNANEDTYFNPDDDKVIAYGEISSGEETEEEGLVKFNIPLKYKNLTDKPTHIVVVCSASKYGDYMSGGEGSTLYLDDFELVYDGIPTIWE